jgi:hypothetical protein
MKVYCCTAGCLSQSLQQQKMQQLQASAQNILGGCCILWLKHVNACRKQATFEDMPIKLLLTVAAAWPSHLYNSSPEKDPQQQHRSSKAAILKRHTACFW